MMAAREKFVVRPTRKHPYGGKLYVINHAGREVLLAVFARHGDAVTAARLFNVHVTKKTAY